MANRKLLQTSWEGFEKAVLPSTAGEVQRIEMRKAFFAGAAMYQTLLLRGVSAGDGVNESDERLMADLDAELSEFGRELDLEVLTRHRGAKA